MHSKSLAPHPAVTTSTEECVRHARSRPCMRAPTSCQWRASSGMMYTRFHPALRGVPSKSAPRPQSHQPKAHTAPQRTHSHQGLVQSLPGLRSHTHSTPQAQQLLLIHAHTFFVDANHACCRLSRCACTCARHCGQQRPNTTGTCAPGTPDQTRPRQARGMQCTCIHMGTHAAVAVGQQQRLGVLRLALCTHRLLPLLLNAAAAAAASTPTRHQCAPCDSCSRSYQGWSQCRLHRLRAAATWWKAVGQAVGNGVHARASS